MSIDSAAMHITPTEDLVDHDLRADCICGPDVCPVKRADGSIAEWIYVHHSLDGRELQE